MPSNAWKDNRGICAILILSSLSKGATAVRRRCVMACDLASGQCSIVRCFNVEGKVATPWRKCASIPPDSVRSVMLGGQVSEKFDLLWCTPKPVLRGNRSVWRVVRCEIALNSSGSGGDSETRLRSSTCS